MATPTIERSRFEQRQLAVTDKKLSWLEDGADARQKFQRLAMDTYDAVRSLGADFVHPFDPWPESAGNALRTGWSNRASQSRVALPDGLSQRWRAWNAEYFILRAKSPKLELRDLMQDISESHTASSWPAGYERHIQDWIDAGDPFAPPPFDNRHNIVTEDLFRQLQRIRHQLKGWMFWDDQIDAVRFAPEAEWRLVRAEQEAIEARQRREWEESRIRSERLGKRCSEVRAVARADDTFWSALREWERNREAKRPATQQLVEAVPPKGRITWRRLTPDEQRESDNPQMDPLFVRFFARVREPDDVMTPRDLVMNLRAEMRRELGYDHVFGWAGGPGIGEA